MPKLITEHQRSLWNPARLGSNLKGWWDAHNTALITLSGSEVTTLGDQSGNGNNLIGDTLSARPNYNSSTKLFGFDGSNDCLIRTSVTNFIVGNNPITLIVGAYPSRASTALGASQDYACYIGANTGVNGELFGINYWSNANNKGVYQRFGNGYNGQDTTSNSGITIATYNTNHTSSTIWCNGSQLTTTANNPTNTVSFTGSHTLIMGAVLANESSTPSSFFQGSMDFFAIVLGTLSTTNRQLIEGWWAYRFNKQSYLPSNHPYKTYPPLL